MRIRGFAVGAGAASVVLATVILVSAAGSSVPASASGPQALPSGQPTASGSATPEPLPSPPAPGGPTSVAPATGVRVQIATINGQEVLVDQANRALYLFTIDTASTSKCESGCASTWPPLIGPATAGAGVDQQKLATSQRSDGTAQVTYFDHPLYHFAGDSQPLQANGEGIAGSFFLIDAQGRAVK